VIRFLQPEAFLLALPVLMLLRGAFTVRPLVAALRLGVLLLACALLAEPFVPSGTSGRDLILVVDRSRSVPADAEARVQEIAELARKQMQAGDRIGVVAFGRTAAVEIPQREDYRFARLQRDVDRDATDIAAGLERALGLIPADRQGSILLCSDGETTGASPIAAARAALRRGVRIDAIALRRPGGTDLAVDEIALPGEVGAGEPFQFSAWLRADRPVEAPLRLLRDGVVIAEAVQPLRAGLNRVLFRDRLAEQGIHRYEVELVAPGDRVVENNRAQAVVRVVGQDQVLCVSERGANGRLSAALRKAGLRVLTSAPRDASLDLDALDGVRAVILENVAADDLLPNALPVLAAFVRDLGGGLLMTGGRASFGPGGYYRTPVEEVLPVTMEVRQEHRRFALALAIALDRSGSMTAPVGAGQTKMDLANLGTLAAVDLLGPSDSLAVIAVDSAPHVVVPMAELTDPEAVSDKVRRIESMGGGIFVGAALEAAARELQKAAQTTKHIVLFADAADSEEPGDYRTFVPKLRSAGVTLSVIGLGDPADQDAALLLELARLGGGRCKFVLDATNLPQVFAQETIQVARSSFAEEPSQVAVLPDIFAIGALAQAFPDLGGYSIAYLKGDATSGLVTTDDVGAPVLSFWQHGLGRSAAFLGEADGTFSGGLASWDGYTDFFATLVRWVGGTRASEEVWADLRREGHEAVLTVELADAATDRLANVEAVVTGPDGPVPVWLTRVDERRLEARLALSGQGVYRAAIKVGADEVVRVPPVTLPYSPEFEPRADPRAGEKLLQRVVEIAEGRVDPPLGELFAGNRASGGLEPLGWLCALLAVVLLLIEIAVRRLDLRLPRVALRARRAARPAEPAAAPASSSDALPESRPPPKPTAPAPAADDAGLGSLLDRARARALRRQ
jgi:uncharacterized membrane protein